LITKKEWESKKGLIKTRQEELGEKEKEIKDQLGLNLYFVKKQDRL